MQLGFGDGDELEAFVDDQGRRIIDITGLLGPKIVVDTTQGVIVRGSIVAGSCSLQQACGEYSTTMGVFVYDLAWGIRCLVVDSLLAMKA